MFRGLTLDSDLFGLLDYTSEASVGFYLYQREAFEWHDGHVHLLDQDLTFQQLLRNSCSYPYQGRDLGQGPAFSFPKTASANSSHTWNPHVGASQRWVKIVTLVITMHSSL